MEPWRARNLVQRYLKAAKGAFSSRISPQASPKARGGLRQQSNLKRSSNDKARS